MLATLWRRYQHWRAMRMLRRVVRLKDEAERLYATANQLLKRNVRSPLPLFDREPRI